MEEKTINLSIDISSKDRAYITSMLSPTYFWQSRLQMKPKDYEFKGGCDFKAKCFEKKGEERNFGINSVMMFKTI